MRNTLLSLLTIIFLSNCSKEDKLEPLLKELDQVINQTNEYDSYKLQKLNNLKLELAMELGKNTGGEKVHELYHQLYKEYETFILDSALYYAKAHLAFSERQNNTSRIYECKMDLAKVYAIFARFPESVELLRSIDQKSLTQQQLGTYYGSFEKVYIQWAECTTGKEAAEYTALKEMYRDSLLKVLNKETYEYDMAYGRKYIELKDFFRARETLQPYLKKLDPDIPDYVHVTSEMAALYEMRGEPENRLEFLMKSAVAGVKASVKENTALRILALYLLEEGKSRHSGIYIKKCVDDAHFYNARLNNAQIAKIVPAINKLSQLEVEGHLEQRNILIFVLCILLILLIYAVSYLMKETKSLEKECTNSARLREELEKKDKKLLETNQLKEEYIRLYITQCAIYTNKLENYRKNLNIKAESHKLDELYQMLKSTRIIEEEWKEFFQNFDTAFLRLFPNFVTEFNKLLPEEMRIIPKQEHSLTTDLRIYAMIRLGITDSNEIANSIRCSIVTVYNNRSMYRIKSLISREKFEEAVSKIDYRKE
jgi:hypothetical protein